MDSAEADRQEESRRRQAMEEEALREEQRQQEEELAKAVEFSKQLTHTDTIRKKREFLQANPEPELGLKMLLYNCVYYNHTNFI